MNRLEIIATRCTALLALIWLVAPAHAQEAVARQASAQPAAEFLSEEAAAPSEAREANPIVDRIEGLRAEGTSTHQHCE